ncbi:MAG: phosphatase domain-containing protein [Pirellulaceae bacterium]
MYRDETAVSDLRETDSVVLYPTFAHPTPDGDGWVVQVHGCVFESTASSLSGRMLIALLGRAMRATKEELLTETFQERIFGFTVRRQGGRRIAVRIGDQIFRLTTRSQKNGQFFGETILTSEEMETLTLDFQLGEFPWTVVSEFPEHTDLPGSIRPIPGEGVSVISDIDDTVKHTQVATQRVMLNNTFLREFETVPGISRLYQHWLLRGAVFHYVTSSPWQLYGPLAQLFVEQGIPSGSFHMKSLRFRDPTVLQLFIARRWTKRKAIRDLMLRFPRRRFILVGDSGEKDPETYGDMARKFPDQIEKILIRDLSGKNSHPYRYMKAFRRLPDNVWQIFRDPEEIDPGLIDDCPGLSVTASP